jgi:hypothetical protein
VQTVDQISRFIANHKVGKLLQSERSHSQGTHIIATDDLYTILIYEALKERDMLPKTLSSPVSHMLRECLYKRTLSELVDTGLLELALYVNALASSELEPSARQLDSDDIDKSRF